jgi:undecaprenyl-diphosphatase
MSETLIAIILGVVEGVTEYLPISSTGHLILFGEALTFTGEKAKSFEVIIQLGAILSVVVLLWPRFTALFNGLFDFKRCLEPGLGGSAGVWKLGMVTAPALFFGFLLHGAIKEHLFRPLPVAAALAVGGIIMIAVERYKGDGEGVEADAITWQQCLLLGCIQCLAMWPGMSRSGTVIIGGMLMGLSRKAAAEFSFLAAVPVLIAAAGLDLVKALPGLTLQDLWLLSIGLLVSFVTALLTMKWFIGLVGRCSLVPFGIYRLVVAGIVVWFWVQNQNSL